jgi:hypothetical protein
MTVKDVVAFLANGLKAQMEEKSLHLAEGHAWQAAHART